MPLTAISLFSGAGGMDLGFDAAGFKTLIAVERDPSCCKTLRANLPAHTTVLEDDIRNLTGRDLLRATGLKRGEVDMVYGGPPCQSFSLAGNRGGLDDERGQMVGEFIRIVHEVLPKAFVMENVKGMANWEGGRVLDFIEERFAHSIEWGRKEALYNVIHQVLDAADFGVPQFRERIFIVGNRLGREFDFPTPTHGPNGSEQKTYATVGEAIVRLPTASAPSETALRVAKTIKGRIKSHGY